VYTCSEPRSTCPDLIGKIPAPSERVASDHRSLVSLQFTPPIFLPTDHCPLTCPVRRSRPCRDPFGVTARICLNSFSCNIYGSSRKCSKQKTYGMAKRFRCNIYKKHGVGSRLWLTRFPMTKSVLRSMATEDLSSHPIMIPGSNDERCLRIPARSALSTSSVPFLSTRGSCLSSAGACEPALGVSPKLRFNFQLSTVNHFRGVPLNTATSAILEDQQ